VATGSVERRERRLVLATLAAIAAAAAVWLVLRSRTAAGPEPPGPRFLAVLPFRDLSGLPDGQLLGDGMVETVSTRLAGVPGVQVVTPSAVVAASDRDGQDIFRIARDLGANLLLRGAVQRQGDRLRVTYSVWNAKARVQVAAGDFTGPASDLFGIQDQLADSVARQLGVSAPARRTPAPSGLATVDEQERYLRALGHLQRHDRPASVDAALSLLDALAAEAPGSALVQAALARANLDKYTLTREKVWATRAFTAAERATRLDAGAPDVHVTRGLVLARTGRGEEAVAEFQVALSQAPNHLEGLLGLADAYESIGKNAEAEAAYRRALSLQPDYWEVPYDLGVFYYRRGRYGPAAEMFQRVVERTPDNVRAWNSLGAAYQQADRFDDALAAYRRSAEVRPNDGAYSNMGTLLYFLGRYPESANAYEQAVKLTPGKSIYWTNLGDAYRWGPGTRPKAAAAYAKAIERARDEIDVDPRDAAVRVNLGLALAKSGQPSAGLEEIRKALEIEPGNPDTFVSAAVVSNLAGKPEDAIGWLRQAVQGGIGVRQIEAEPELENLRKLEEYKKIFSRTESTPGNGGRRTS
jgi:serine/threonine-protein kinase